ncbi:MAG: hypothetical protein GC131_03905 [Alphaproteobacteria bacterium]|nr:hypothetical protein [Alphaproteobacteria bacterium]
MLLVPEKKLPMIVWEEWSDIVYDRMGVIAATLFEHAREKEAKFFEFYRAELKELWLKTKDSQRDELYRQNYAMIYRRFLRELPKTAETLQDLLGDDWRAGFSEVPERRKGEQTDGDNGGIGFKTLRAAMIFGYPDYDNPRGIADGWPRPGYLTFVMRNMILGQVGFLYMGALKPRDGITPGSMPALGYEMDNRMHGEERMMRSIFNVAPKPAA